MFKVLKAYKSYCLKSILKKFIIIIFATYLESHLYS